MVRQSQKLLANRSGPQIPAEFATRAPNAGPDRTKLVQPLLARLMQGPQPVRGAACARGRSAAGRYPGVRPMRVIARNTRALGDAGGLLPRPQRRHGAGQSAGGKTPTRSGRRLALLSNFGPVVLMDFGPPPVPQPTVARVDRGAWRGLESQSGFVRAATSGA